MKVEGCRIIMQTEVGHERGHTFKMALEIGADYVRHNGVEVVVESDDDVNSLEIKWLYLARDEGCDLDKLMKKYRRMSWKRKTAEWMELVGK